MRITPDQKEEKALRLYDETQSPSLQVRIVRPCYEEHESARHSGHRERFV